MTDTARRSLHLSVQTPAERLLELDDVAWAQVELADGSIGIWPGHAPLVAEMARASLRWADAQGEHRRALEAGILEIAHNRVTIMTVGFASREDREHVAEGAGAEAAFARLSQAFLSGIGPHSRTAEDEKGRV